MPEGSLKKYDGIAIPDLIKAGSANEDLGTRARNHFWNPCKDKGLDDLITGLPNTSWALGYGEDGEQLYACGWGSHWADGSCNDYSWRKARERFYAALTGITEEARSENFKEMYESLGRIIHLIEDMGVPAHTRNDFSGHLDYAELKGRDPMSWLGNLYEFHVKKRARGNASYIPSLAQGASVPVFATPREYWDAGVYTGADPDATVAGGGPPAGLAEYCNANFLSRFTIFTDGLPQEHKHYHPFPDEASLSTQTAVPHEVTAEDGKVDLVLHSAKDKHGERIDDFVAARYAADRIYAASENDMIVYRRLAYYLDDTVHEAYAAKLIPKTVGYAAGLINHFFRGTMAIGKATVQTSSDRYRIDLPVSNTTTTGEDMSGGSIELIIKYPTGEDTYGYFRTFEANGKNTVPGSLSFDVERDKLPNRQLDGLLDLFVVYRGNLGTGSTVHETDAVCVGHKQVQFFSSTNPELVDISPPCPWCLGDGGSVCAYNLFPGCEYRLEIADIVYGGPGELSVCFAHNYCRTPSECYGDAIEDLRGFHLQDRCTTVNCGEWNRGIGVLLYPWVDKDPEVRFHPGDFYEIEIVLTNLTTGGVHRVRKRCEYEGTCTQILRE